MACDDPPVDGPLSSGLPGAADARGPGAAGRPAAVRRGDGARDRGGPAAPGRAPRALVAAALTQARLRARARPKLGDARGPALADRRRPGAGHPAGGGGPARRAVRRRGGRVRSLDLCCGIGGDLPALAGRRPGRAGRRPRPARRRGRARPTSPCSGSADRAEVRCARRRCDHRPRPARTRRLRRPGPAQRPRRALDPRAYSPPFDVRARAGRPGCPATGAKLAPGLAARRCCRRAPRPSGCRSAATSSSARCGAGRWRPGRPGGRRCCPSGATLTGDGTRPGAGRARSVATCYEPDGAVIRAGLVAEVAEPLDGTPGRPDHRLRDHATGRSPTPFAARRTR